MFASLKPNAKTAEKKKHNKYGKKSRTQGWGRESILRIKRGENPGCQLLPAATRGRHENSTHLAKCHEIWSNGDKISISGALDLRWFQFGSDSRSFSRPPKNRYS
jgi:hypothetical protein